MAKKRILLSLLLLSLLSSAPSLASSLSSSPPPTDSPSPYHYLLAKGWCLVFAFYVTLGCGMSPYYMKSSEGFLVLGTQFAGGVLLGTAMLHFLSQSNEAFGDLTTKQYPFAHMLACAGYLVTMLADHVISRVCGKNIGIGTTVGDVEIQGNGRSGIHGISTGLQHQGHDSHNISFVKAPVLVVICASSSLGLWDAILLIVAQCFHSVLEGIAIGVAETNPDAWKTLRTICLHKIPAAIAMGIALLRMIPFFPFLSCLNYAVTLAAPSLIGVAIGIVIDSTTQGVVADWVFAISMALASGVLLYVSVHHLLGKGYYLPHKSVHLVDTPFYKFMAVFLGIGVIAVVMIWDT